MFYRNLILFVIVCILTGLATFVGSVIGHGFGPHALFAGAIIGGIAGVFVSCLIAGKLKKVEPNFRSTFVGGVIGYTIACIIAVNSLHSASTTAGSIALAGLGAVAGNSLSKKH
jgi:hypothetical protein